MGDIVGFAALLIGVLLIGGVIGGALGFWIANHIHATVNTATGATTAVVRDVTSKMSALTNEIRGTASPAPTAAKPTP